MRLLKQRASGFFCFHTKQCLIRLCILALTIFIFATGRLQAQQQNSSILGQWWNGPYATGDWGGYRTFLEDRGFKLDASTASTYYGVPTANFRNNSIYSYELIVDGIFDFGKMFGWQGLKGQAGIQWQKGENRFNECSTGVAFSPLAYIGDWTWRLRPIVLTYVTPELFGVREFLTLSGGWQNAKDYFLVQPSADFFQNNAFSGGASIVANGGFFDGWYRAWGGYAKVKPTEWYYLQAGLWAAVPNALDWRNRGIYFALAQPPYRNGLFFMGETGFTPQLGSNRLPGKYAFGGYYWGLSCPSFFGASYPGKFGFYWQADQMLYREPNAVATFDSGFSKNDGKGSTKAFTREESLSPQGLYAFGLINYAPKFNNEIPFFFRTGLVYKGLIPTRDKDDVGIAFGFGTYSYYKILANRAKGITTHRTTEAVLEVDYRFQINRWLYVQPFAEYLIRPNGNGLAKDALVAGIRANLIF